jgi:hypothetical protein
MCTTGGDTSFCVIYIEDFYFNQATTSGIYAVGSASFSAAHDSCTSTPDQHTMGASSRSRDFICSSGHPVKVKTAPTNPALDSDLAFFWTATLKVDSSA